MANSLRWWFGGLVLLLLAAACVRLVLSENLTERLDRAIVGIQVSRDANAQAMQALTDVETGVRGYQLTRDRSFLQPAIDGRRSYNRAIERAIAAAPDARTRALLEVEQGRADGWLAGFAAPIIATDPASVSVNRDVILTGRRRFDDVRLAHTAVGVALDDTNAKAVEQVRQSGRAADIVGVLLSILSALAVLLVAGRLSNALISPLQGLRCTLRQLGAGDRTARAVETGPPEMRQVIRSFNEQCDESDRLRAAETRRMEMQELAHHIAARLRTSLERDTVLQEAATALGAALGAQRAYVQLDDLSDIAWQWQSVGAAPLSEPVPVTGGDQIAAVTVAADDDPVGASTGAVAYVTAPFGVNDERAGSLVITSPTAREWTPDELALVRAVCADLGRALEQVRLYEHERRLVEQLRELDQHKSDFIATVSHELRTPLTSVLGYLEVLTNGDQGPLTDRQLRSLRVIERNAERLGEMVADLLTLSRIESGTFALELAPVQVLEAVQRAAAALIPVAAGAGLDFEVHVPEDLWTTADVAQLKRIVVNLVANAVKFSPRGGSVSVRASASAADPAWVSLVVADSGMGIPEHEQAKLFQPFQRGSNAVANATQGPGLGLAVVRSIVEQHHGRVELDSAPGRGTTVTVHLPRVAAPSAAPAAGAVATR